MNGTSVATQLNLPNPGAGQQSENGHPFTATVFNSASTATNAADPGSGSPRLSAPDSGAAGGSSSSSNQLHMSLPGASA
jgi:hypothetical protein